MKKLISIATVITCLSINVIGQSFQQRQYSLVPQFQAPSVEEFVSKNSLYLPPETQTTLPLFSLNNENKLQYQYLPPTGTKAPPVYPSPFPMMMSSTFVPNFDDDEDDDNDRNDEQYNMRFSTPQPQSIYRVRSNQTQSTPQKSNEKKEFRSLPKMVSYTHPIDRVDIKIPSKYEPTPYPLNTQTAASRRMIITTENVKNEPSIADHVKTPSFHGLQYLAAPTNILISTTEPAIPILRLSNEMDLDGSYSYEALGADQTHYVQHSRMENMGTDKQEQVVEGSYSYVGDNGQTFTVHYIADSNGFRASGDHLPVPPPMPEIIQRSIQYNLAEEAKRPPHLQEWHNEEKYNEIESRENVHRYIPTQPPHRNLFTGRTPEAFSYNFVKSPNQQTSNLITSPSSQAPTIAHIEPVKDQIPKESKLSGQISPQITFLASQGAHVPSMNAPQQSISRGFNNEKQGMPKLMNYELTTIENEQENNKPLWRWQYGINANPTKTSISRSSGLNEDEVTINFNEMTPEQYKYMIHSQFDSNNNENNQFDISSKTPPVNAKDVNHQNTEDTNLSTHSTTSLFNIPNRMNEQPRNTQSISNSELDNNYKIDTVTVANSNTWFTEPSNNFHKEVYNNQNLRIENRETMNNHKPKLITQHDFIPQSQVVTQAYDYDEIYYEPRKIQFQTPMTLVQNGNRNNLNENNIERPSPITEENPENFWNNNEHNDNEELIKINTTPQPVITPEYTYQKPVFNNEQQTNFRPIRPLIETGKQTVGNKEDEPDYVTTTENTVEDLLKSNIFLKNLLNPTKTKLENESINIIKEQSNKTIENNKFANIKEDKVSKAIKTNHNTNNDIKFVMRKPVDISDVMNYVSMKNNFESNKIKPKSNKHMHDNNRDIEISSAPSGADSIDLEHRKAIRKHNEEILRGILKKYNTIQRQNNNIGQGNKEIYIRRDLTPPEINAFPVRNLPPLGRAGPTAKSYLPPIYL